MINGKEHPFIKWIDKKVHKEKGNCVVMIDGWPGSGKSYAALDLCKTFDPKFNIDYVAFTLLDVMKILKECATTGERGRAIMLDEAGVAGNSKRFMAKESQMYEEILRMMRFLGNLFVTTSPNFGDYLKSARQLADVRIIFEKSQKLVLAKKKGYTFAELRMLSFGKYDGKVYSSRLRISPSEEIASIRFDMPPKELVKSYENAKQDNFLANIEANIKQIEQNQYNKYLKKTLS
jgi:hypothetical protein